LELKVNYEGEHEAIKKDARYLARRYAPKGSTYKDKVKDLEQQYYMYYFDPKVIAKAINSDGTINRAWAHMIVKYKLIDFIRSRAFNYSYKNSIEFVDFEKIKHTLQLVPAYDDDPSDIAMERAEAKRFISLLTDKQRKVILSKFWLNLSDREIGEREGLPRTTIWKRRTKGMARMRTRREYHTL